MNRPKKKDSGFTSDHSKENREGTQLVIRNISKREKKKFREWCKMRGYTMTSKIRLLIRDCIFGRME